MEYGSRLIEIDFFIENVFYRLDTAETLIHDLA